MATGHPDIVLAQSWLREAVAQSVQRDHHLWRVAASERSRVARVHHYLATAVEPHGWDVDCEYNRNLTGLKELERDGRSTYGVPDVVIHRRGTAENLLIVEFKPTHRATDPGSPDDRKMLQWLRTLDYACGALVSFGPPFRRLAGSATQDVDPRIVWYLDGTRAGEERGILDTPR